MSVLLSHLIMAAFSIPALAWLRLDLRLVFHRPRRWAPLLCLAAYLSLLAIRLGLPIQADFEPVVGALAGACLLGRESNTLHRRRGRLARVFSLVSAGLLGILTVSGAWRFLNMLAAAVCLMVCLLLTFVYRDKTRGWDPLTKKLVKAGPWFWLLVEATSWLGPPSLRHVARLYGLVFLAVRVYLAGRKARTRQTLSVHGVAALQRASFHQLRNAFAGIAQLARFTLDSPDEADRRRCLGLVQEYSQDSLRTLMALDAAARGASPSGRPEAETRQLMKTALVAWRDRVDLRGWAGQAAQGQHPCLPLLVDCVQGCTRVFDLRWVGMLLETRPDQQTWGIQLEFAGNPLVGPLLQLFLRRRLGSQPILKRHRPQLQVFRVSPFSRLRVECILSD